MSALSLARRAAGWSGLILTALTLRAGPAAPTPDSVSLAMLTNIRDHGTNPGANGGLGGLWINWRTGTEPLQVNFNGSGLPDGAKVNPPRHDDLTDLRYLHNLQSWKHLHPDDRGFDAELARYTAIVKRELAGTHNERGWMYDELMDMARLSGDAFFRDTARNLAEFYATKSFQPDIGAMYKTTNGKTRGHYRVDLVLEAGCAMVQAGVVFGQPEWRARGERLADFVYAHAYLRDSHLFLSQMDDVRLPDGTANPDEKIYREPYKNYEANGGVVRFGGIGQIALSLLHTAIVTGDEKWRARAWDLLDPLTAEKNSLGLWDARDGGYFSGVEFPGADFAHPGTPKLNRNTKESGRQFHMLQAYHVADMLEPGRYHAMVERLEQVALEKAYTAPVRGIYYEARPDWSPRPTKAGVADWVTTEAMGCAMMALFSLEEKDPW